MFIFLALQGGHAESTELQKPIGYQKPAPPPELVAAANAAATGKPFGGYEVKSNGKIVGGQGVVGVPLWQSDNGKVSVGGSLSAGFVGGKGTGAIKKNPSFGAGLSLNIKFRWTSACRLCPMTPQKLVELDTTEFGRIEHLRIW